MRWRDTIPDWLAAGTRIEIQTRQATFWDLSVGPSSPICRVHFRGKVEFDHATDLASRIALHSSHPLLTEYEEPRDQVFVSSSASAPVATLTALHELCDEHFAGWRHLARYLNNQFPPARVLRDGYGLLLTGPRTFLSAASALLATHSIETQTHRGTGGRRSLLTLEIGRSFVIAEHFEFEHAPHAA